MCVQDRQSTTGTDMSLALFSTMNEWQFSALGGMSDFLLVRCLYNKQNITWLLGDMELNTSREVSYLCVPIYSPFK